MKPLLFTLLFVLPMMGFSQEITEGLVGYWPLDGNADDLTSNFNHGTVYSASLTTDRFGSENSAYFFDGTDDYIDFGDILLDGSTEFTILFWVNVIELGTNNTPIGHDGNNEPHVIHKAGSADDSFGLTVNQVGTAFYVDNGTDHTLLGTTIEQNAWIHVTLIFNNSNLSLFFNGQLDSQISINSSPLISTTNTLTVGGRPAFNASFFNGKFDDLLIYNRELSNSEINEIFLSNAQPSDCHFCVENGDNIYLDHNLGIHTTYIPSEFSLAINGKAIMDEVNVQLEVNWPDYVFEPDYRLPSLREVENHIKANKHLPDVPSAKEIENEGVNLGEMNALLLKKIEELTLYQIKLLEKIEDLERQVQQITPMD